MLEVNILYELLDIAFLYLLYTTGKAMAETIAWSGRQTYNAAQLESIEIAGVEAGKYKSVGGLSYFEIESAGHMVPMDQPAGSSVVLQHMLKSLK